MYKLSKLWKRLSTTLSSRKRKSKEQHSPKKINEEAPKVALRLPSIILVSEKEDKAATPELEITESLPRHMEKRGGPVPLQNRPAAKEEEPPRFHPELESRPVSQIPQEPSPRTLLREIKSDITSISDRIDTLAYESTRRRIDLGLVKMETLQTMLERSNEESRAFGTVGVAKMVDEIERRLVTQLEGMERRLSQKFERTVGQIGGGGVEAEIPISGVEGGAGAEAEETSHKPASKIIKPAQENLPKQHHPPHHEPPTNTRATSRRSIVKAKRIENNGP